MDVLRVGERIAALACGPYSRRSQYFVFSHESGWIDSQDAASDDMSSRQRPMVAARPREQDIPLDIPKKTKLYLDQTEREREMAPRCTGASNKRRSTSK